jgi:6-phosphogluconate dehydrogenase
MAERWLRGGHRVVAHIRSRGSIDELAAKGADAAYSVEQLVAKLQPEGDIRGMPMLAL